MRSRDGPAYGWVVLGAFTFNYSLVDISILTLGLLLPDISAEFSLSPSQQGWLASSVLFANLIFEIPANLWLSRYRPWRVASISFLLAALFVVLSGWAPTFTLLLVTRLALGLAYLCSKVPRTLVILQWVPRKQIALANGIMFSVIDGLGGIGFIVIPFIMVGLGGWRNTLYAWAGACLFASVTWLILGRDRVTPEYSTALRSQVKTPLGTILRYKEPWILGFGLGGAIAARFAFSAFWPTFAQNEYGIALTYSGLIIGLMSFASMPAKVGVTILPFLVDRTPMVLVACGLGMWATFLGFLYIGSLPALFLMGVLNGVSFSFIPLVMTRIYNLPGIKPREVTVAVALMFTLLWAGGALGPLLAGLVQEATDDLRLGLVITSFGSLSLSLSGLALLGMGRRESGGALER
jgi:predicted MFS family arabinose efflux permease